MNFVRNNTVTGYIATPVNFLLVIYLNKNRLTYCYLIFYFCILIVTYDYYYTVCYYYAGMYTTFYCNVTYPTHVLITKRIIKYYIYAYHLTISS